MMGVSLCCSAVRSFLKLNHQMNRPWPMLHKSYQLWVTSVICEFILSFLHTTEMIALPACTTLANGSPPVLNRNKQTVFCLQCIISTAQWTIVLHLAVMTAKTCLHCYLLEGVMSEGRLAFTIFTYIRQLLLFFLGQVLHRATQMTQ